jgi:hypothetical protein
MAKIEVGDSVAIVYGMYTGYFGIVERETFSSLVVKIPHGTVTIRKTSVRAPTNQETLAPQKTNQAAEEVKLLACNLAVHLANPNNRGQMYDLFMTELKKELGDNSYLK